MIALDTQVVEGALEITEKRLQELHRQLTDKLDEKEHAPGRYFADTARAETPHLGSAYSGARIQSDVKLLIKEFLTWINNADIIELGVEVRATLAHYHILTIAPFKSMNSTRGQAHGIDNTGLCRKKLSTPACSQATISGIMIIIRAR